jgi:hypothetical protein
MSVFSFLDATSLAAFSETGRRPNFECFYFLELQLQRALLTGDGHHVRHDLLEEAAGGDRASGAVEDGSVDDSEVPPNEGPEDEEEASSDAVPSFEGSIAGAGVVSRLASLDPASARKIVQTYLDSNASMRSMPLVHSLAYLRQALMRQYPMSFPRLSPMKGMSAGVEENGDGTKNNARNAALLFAFLGAAYVRAQQAGGGDPAALLPDPTEVLNEENVEALKNMMLKVGFMGGFLKAGQTMKERVEEGRERERAEEAVAAGRVRANGDNQGDNSGQDARDEVPVGLARDQSHGDDAASNWDEAVGNGNDVTHDVTNAQEARASQQRSSSIGSLEDLSRVIPHPSAIASRLYSAFSNSNNSANHSNNSHLGGEGHEEIREASVEGQPSEGTSSPKRRRHRSKRSHKTLRHEIDGADDAGWEEEKKSSEPELSAPTNDHTNPQESPEEMAYAMDHPLSPNPYEHPSSTSLSALSAAAEGGNKKTGTSKGDTVAASEATSFFSFITNAPTDPSSAMYMPGSGTVPTGCIGAYANAVKTAASEVTRLVKAERKANFDSLSPEEQHRLGVQFIDACSSDDSLHIVKDMLQRQRMMDVDRFFVGRDDTETCSLHAAAFNGAERVLEFLCGGIDERDPSKDGGLCDVDVRDGNGWTALHFAAGANSVTSVRVLSGHGAKLTIEAGNGYTPYHWAERLSNEEAATELGKLGADNRFVGGWMFGRGGGAGSTPAGGDRKIPFVSFLANRFFALSGRQ